MLMLGGLLSRMVLGRLDHLGQEECSVESIVMGMFGAMAGMRHQCVTNSPHENIR